MTQGTAEAPILQPLADQGRPEGCGCHLRLGRSDGAPYVFWNDGQPWMNLGGADTPLAGAQGLDPGVAAYGVGPAVLGAKHVDRYHTDDARVVIEYTVTRVCQTGGEPCDSTGVDAVITAERGGRREIVTASGACGC